MTIRDSSPILSATEDALLRFGLTAFANLLLLVGHCDTRSPARFFMISLFGTPVAMERVRQRPRIAKCETQN
jgi:hypothetical protein